MVVSKNSRAQQSRIKQESLAKSPVYNLEAVPGPFGKILQYFSYKLGLKGPEAQRVMKKYSSDHHIPRSVLLDVHVLCG
ncbi:hypothetical protein VP01_619g3 [Puccinia sorghi]|uniref:Uncharacterized protein n=1 Tax=Puccinia sorghi TaxID=27349 RepID=A0A0L6UGQ7_9BASI|nr:hypothetical protein VP01_619g3 [Puccinia sorghi]